MSAARVARAELYRWSRTGSLAAILGAPALVGVLQVALGRLFEDWNNLARPGAGAGGAEPGNGFGPLADGVHRGAAVLALVAVLLGSLSLVRERERGSLALTLLACPRGAFLAGKLLAVLAAVLLAALLLLLACTAAAACWYPLGPVVEDGFEMASRRELLSEILRCTAASVPALWACASWGVLWSAFLPTSGAAVALAIVPFLGLAFLLEMLGQGGRYVFLTYVPLPGPGKAAPLARLPDVARAFSDALFEPGELARAAGVAGVEALALALLAWLCFRRS